MGRKRVAMTTKLKTICRSEAAGVVRLMRTRATAAAATTTTTTTTMGMEDGRWREEGIKEKEAGLPKWGVRRVTCDVSMTSVARQMSTSRSLERVTSDQIELM